MTVLTRGEVADLKERAICLDGGYTMQIRNRFTGKILFEVEGDTLVGANLSGANLEGAIGL